MGKKTIDIDRIHKAQRKFTKAREWDQFHTPKNIAMALSVEASELLEIFQWLTKEQSTKVMKDKITAKKIRNEMADVLFYFCRLSDLLGIDVEAAFWEKMEENARKYPVKLSKGNAKKYDAFG